MIKTIDGITFKNMVDYAVRNLNKHRKTVNQLNVFPVPDGDTGTNMVTTIHKGLLAVNETLIKLPEISRKFAHSVVFEARGNSGVIVSQFLKGLSEQFYDHDTVDGEQFIGALEQGVKSAYAAVATPVEGTMLTVLKEATAAVRERSYPGQDIREIVSLLLEHAKVSLDHTPELLPVLKESGVVDSGGAGIVYLFEGMKMYLGGENPEDVVATEGDQAPTVDYDAFDRDSTFQYGYCTELLVQLLNGYEDFDPAAFKEQLSAIGDSLVISAQGGKVRVHIHTKTPEQVFSLCHRYGEFLTLKVENMTVQHTELNKKFLFSQEKTDSTFAVAAVAYDAEIQKLLINMGADVSIYNEEGVSTKDYIEAFDKLGKQQIIVFPNNSDAVMAALQAKKLYDKAKIIVINSRNLAECYAALPLIDFSEGDADVVADQIVSIMNNLYVVSVAQRKNPIQYRDHNIYQNEYYSFSGKELLLIGKTLEETVVRTVEQTLNNQAKEIITLFHTRSLPDEQLESMLNGIEALGICVEIFTVPVEKLPSDLVLSFE
ncbi:MAG: DAK2 domain-containing protein [Clostridia bacterium]|nr:DAK2 domain-containing protein [Clostridia bacterium]